ncbi:MAG: transglutaminase-like domain-containing protein [Gemmatimonadaceae bacterium]
MNARGFVAATVLAAWGAGIAVFVQREMSRSARERLAEAAMRIAPVASYYAMTQGRQHVGFASFTTDTVPDGLQFTEYSVRDATSGDTVRREAHQVVARTSRSLVVREVVVTHGASVARAIVLDDSTLVVVRDRGQGDDTTRQRYSPPLLLPSVVPLAIALGDAPEPGDRHTFDVFDPSSLTVRQIAVTVRAESSWVLIDSASYDGGTKRWLGAHADTVQAWHVVEEGEHGIDAWVDELGQLVAARQTDELSLRRTAYEVAFENWRSASRARGSAPSGARALGTLVSVPPDRAAGRLARLTLVARGLPLDRLAAATEWQTVAGDTLRVLAPARSGRPNGYWLPPQRDFRAQFVRHLQVEPGIEADAPALVAASRRLRARETDPVTFALRLTRWVADSVQLEATLAPPSALATLRSRAGDADHHTNLFVALARAAGLPARPVRGFVRRGERMLAHSWSEVYVGGQWLPVDPTSGQFPTDAGHVRLLIGPVTARDDLERLVLRASIDILPSSAASPRSPSHRP